jgi:cytochrome c-type biogenesis protein CcmH
MSLEPLEELGTTFGLQQGPLRARTPAMTRSPLLRGLPGLILGVGLSFSGVAFGHSPSPAGSVAPEDDYGEDIQGSVPGASAIEGRLMAPCCWTQTIDIHDSPMSLSMRHEIRRRLRNGESAEVIQASFVERYGAKIMAVQEGSHLKNVFIGLSVVMGGAGVAAAMMIGRWRKQSAAKDAPKKDATEPARDQWDEKLDAELKDLDKD